MKSFNKFKFGSSFDNLPYEIKKEIFLKNALHYQTNLANLQIDINKLIINHNMYVERLKDEKKDINYLHYKNLSRTGTTLQKKEANNILKERYEPIIKTIELYIKIRKEQLEQKNKEYLENKKLYWFNYGHLKRLLNSIEK